ncbi:MAG: NAD(+)/NADH kinase, partial [Cellulomonadaceae bacterium]
MSRTAVVVTHGGRPEAVVALREAVQELTRAGFEVVLHDQDQARSLAGLETENVQTAGPADGIGDAEIVVVLGGDGTILRAAELTRGTRVPLLGINLGHVGFLAESERDDLSAAVARVASRDYEVEQRAVVDVFVHLPGYEGPVRGWAL